VVEPTFVLLIPTQVPERFAGFGELPPAIAPLPPAQSGSHVALRSEFEQRLLGRTFQQAGRISRLPC
jgi:hypothetical protein